ncbi:MAG: hypothetical protein V7L11_10800 [Nostoc sp.]|uniref:hypothetical protein n=1 Tax=Nostoc sp. TaxID=1180 RepID=UPI002FF45F05
MNRISTDGLFVALFFQIGITFIAIKNRSDRFYLSLTKTFVSLPIVVSAIAQKKEAIYLTSMSSLY